MPSGAIQLFLPATQPFFCAAQKNIFRSQIINRTVQSPGVIVFDIGCDMPPGIFDGDIAGLPDLFLFDGAMKPLQLAIALRMIRRGSDMSKPAQANELFKVLADKLRAVVTDDPGRNPRELLHRAHHSDLNIIFGHVGAKFMVHNKSSGTIQNRDQKIDRAQDIHIHNVDMPVLMRLEWLFEALFSCRSGGCPATEQPRLFQDTIRCRWAHSNDIVIEHHISQTAVTFVQSTTAIGNDTDPFFRQDPVVLGNLAVMVIGLLYAFEPLIISASANPEPSDEPPAGQVGKLNHLVNKTNDLVANIRFDPLSG